MSKLQSEVNKLVELIDQLRLVLSDISALEPRFQRLIAETAMLRLFYGLDNFSEAVALKLLTNTDYGDGSIPNRINPPFRSKALAAESVLRSRGARIRYLKWTTLQDYQMNLAGFLPANEHLLTERQVIDRVMEDMRHIRNHIAHGTKSTRVKFTAVVRSIYLGNTRGISPGKLLLSRKLGFVGAPGHGRTSIIEQYLLWSKVAAKALTKC